MKDIANCFSKQDKLEFQLNIQLFYDEGDIFDKYNNQYKKTIDNGLEKYRESLLSNQKEIDSSINKVEFNNDEHAVKKDSFSINQESDLLGAQKINSLTANENKVGIILLMLDIIGSGITPGLGLAGKLLLFYCHFLQLHR